jgi:sigma-E factor negative regulatory protein RseC
MQETRAIVMRVEGMEAIVEPVQGGGCGLCAGGKGCGSGRISQALCARPRQFRVHNEVNAGIGDEVLVAVADGILFRSALILYGLPLLLLFTGALSGAHWMGGSEGQHDAGAVIGAAAGLLAGLLLARFIASRQRASFLSLSAIVR